MHDESTRGAEADQPDPETAAIWDRSRQKELLGIPQPTEVETARIGWVYFVLAPEVDKIKIGSTTKHPSKRLAALRQQCPLDMWPVGILRGSSYVEHHLQSMFRYIQWRYEWFETGDMLAKFIIDHAAPWSVADEVDYTREFPIAEAAEAIKRIVADIDHWTSRRADSIWKAGENRKPRNPVRLNRQGLPATTTPKRVLAHYDALSDDIKYGHNDRWLMSHLNWQGGIP